MSDIESKPGASPLDRQDSRVRQDESVAGTLRGFIDRVRSGDLGSLPVIRRSLGYFQNPSCGTGPDSRTCGRYPFVTKFGDSPWRSSP